MPDSGGHSRFFALPATALGRWAVALGVAFFALMAVFYGFVAMEWGVGEDRFIDQWPLWGSIIPAAACGFGAAICGVWSLVRKGERSILVVLMTLIGLFVVWFVSAELFFPH